MSVGEKTGRSKERKENKKEKLKKANCGVS
jgi:hypothetical protein